MLTGGLTLFGSAQESNVCLNTLKCLMLLIDATSLMGIEKKNWIDSVFSYNQFIDKMNDYSSRTTRTHQAEHHDAPKQGGCRLKKI